MPDEDHRGEDPTTDPSGSPSVLGGTFCEVATSVMDFRRRHPGWLEALEGAGPVYRLPLSAIEALQRPPAKRQPILSDTEASAERDFANFCEFHAAIGLWNQGFVSPSYLTCTAALSLRQMQAMKRTPAQIRSAQTLAKKLDSLWLRLKGYVGWLLTEPSFLHAWDDLAAQWNALPEGHRPRPISRSLPLTDVPSGVKRASPEAAGFQTDLNAFLDRWGLTGMLTWDFPESQGPLLPATLPPDAPAMPKHGVHLVLPIHYPLTGNDDLLRRIRDEQTRRAKELGLAPSLAGLAHYEVYGQILEVESLEKTIRSRYYRPGRRRGFMTAIEYVVAETLEISGHQVHRLRKGITKCRAGQRASVKWLRTDRG